MLQIAEKSGESDYALICYIKRRNIPMHMNYCSKIFATYLRSNGIKQEIIDLLQGRIPKSIFVRHYYRPDLDSLESQKLFKTTGKFN
ncbi:MAG: integrase [Nitrososphaeraceae archaeon]